SSGNTGGMGTPTTVTTTAIPVVPMVKRTISVFNGKDYAIWVYHMKNLLEECGLEDYWKPQMQITAYDTAKDRKALREITLTLSNGQMKLMINATTANEAWEILHNHHQQASASNRFHLKTQLFNMQMKSKSKESIQDYANRVDELANQGNSLTSTPA